MLPVAPETVAVPAGIGLLYLTTGFGVAIMALHIKYIRAVFRWRPPTPSGGGNPFFTIQVPVRNEPEGILEDILGNFARLDYPRDRYEVIIISDDEREHAERLRRVVEKVSGSTGLQARFLWRERPSGWKAGALNYATRVSRGEYVIVIDVDTRVPTDFLRQVSRHLSDEYDAYVTRWGPSHDQATKTAKALSVVQDILSEMVEKGRFAAFGNAPLIGSGCIVRKSVLEEVGGWCEECISEDNDMALRLIVRGRRVGFMPIRLEVGVPYDYKGFKKQQLRWIYGSIYTLRRNMVDVLRSRSLGFWQKLDALLYYAQYLGVILYALSLLSTTLLLSFASAFEPAVLAAEAVFWPVSIYYLALLNRLAKKLGYRPRSMLRSLGRAAAMIVAVSLPGVAAGARAALGLPYYWAVTPKKASGSGVPRWGELLVALLLLGGGVAALLYSKYVLSAYLMVNSVPFGYVALRRDL